MWKPIAAGAAALLIAGSSVVFAQNQNRPGRDRLRDWRPSVEDMRAFGEARLAALKAGLALTPEQ
jgi:zinc resistance-associated protein